ncbi:hypothetical protein J6590_086731, partial [Homalodisca vitripennis]
FKLNIYPFTMREVSQEQKVFQLNTELEKFHTGEHGEQTTLTWMPRVAALLSECVNFY